MKTREKETFLYLMKMYEDQWDRNDYYRKNHDTDLEYYLGYRNKNKYPLAYNENFNRILPLIYTILSRFMSHLYQGGNIVSVKPRKNRDINNSKAVESVLNFQLENMNCIDDNSGSYNVFLKWFFNALTFGKGILKAYWRKEDRISPRRIAQPVPSFDSMGNFQGWDISDHISMEMQTVYDQPYFEVLHNKTCVPHPEYKSIQQMPGFFVVYPRSIDYVKKMVQKGEFRNIKELMPGGSGAGTEPRDSYERFIKSREISGMVWKEQLKDEKRVPEIDIIEAYTKLILEDEPYEVGSGIKIKGREEEVIAHIGNYATLLSVQRNPYGYRPFFDIGTYMQPELYWDVGITRLTHGIQEQINNIANLRIQNVMMQINQMLRIDPNSDVDPKALVWRPFGIIPAEEGEVEPITVPDYHSNMFVEQEQFLEHTVQDLAGMYGYGKGETPQRAERVGVVHSIQSMGEARAKLMLMSMDHQGIRPLLKYMMILNTFHLPSGFEYRIFDGTNQQFGQIFGDDIHPDFDFSARYSAMEPPLSKEFRNQQILQLTPVLQQNPYINQQQWLKTIFELGDIREGDALLKSPQQLQQEQQQQMQMQMQAQQAQLQGQAQLEMLKRQADTRGKSALSDQDFVEELALNEQEFGFDRALKAIENEVSSEGKS
jgi:hypothetical protein